MIISISLSIPKLLKEGKSFAWTKPSSCPKCSSVLWGHGHVFSNRLFLKRYRCGSCQTVVTLKPFGFWPRYRTSIDDIYRSLRHRLEHYQWHETTLRHRALHWLKKFIVSILMNGLAEASERPLVERLDDYYQKEIPFLSL